MSYKDGIIKAIEDLQDRTGSSMIAIKKHMQNMFPEDKKWRNTMFLSALKTGVTKGEFVQVKNSYKLSPDFKKKRTEGLKPKKKKEPAASPKKPTPKKVSTSTSKKSVPKKKATSAKVSKPSVKKPVAKKTSAKKKPASKAKSPKKSSSKK